jgi:hypothetical protein
MMREKEREERGLRKSCGDAGGDNEVHKMG